MKLLIQKMFVVVLMLSLVISCKTTNKEIKFDKIIFHSSACFGMCNTYHLEIDSTKKVFLFVQEKYNNDAEPFISYNLEDSSMGYFKGMMDDCTFLKITKAFQKVGIDSLEFPEVLCCDGQVITIIAYYNGKRKYLKSMIPPEKSYQLINVLMRFCNHHSLPRTKDTFKIEE